MNVIEMTGTLLDDWVARALGFKNSHLVPDELCGTWYVGECIGGIEDWSPSTKWAQSGPIIERERISIRHIVHPVYSDLRDLKPMIAASLECRPELQRLGEPVIGAGWYIGETPLIAAMRAYVASKFGDEVEYPE